MKLPIKKGIALSFIYASIPVIVKASTSDDSYNFKENWIIFGTQWMAVFMFKIMNYFLIIFALVLIEMKLEFKKQGIAMINPRFKFTHKVTPVLPELLEASSSNI